MDLYEIANTLVQETIKEMKDPKYDGVTCEDYRKNVATIQLKSFRGSGHTTAAMRLALQFERPLVIFATGHGEKFARQQYPDVKFESTCSLDSLDYALNGLVFDAIIVDSASEIDSFKLEKLYQRTRMDRPIYILLG
jgi:hypothetical protein